MLASRTLSTVTIGEVTVTIQKLNWKVQRQAATLQYERIVKTASALSASATTSSEELQKAFEAREKERQNEPIDLVRVREQRYGQYDRDVVLRGFVDEAGA